MILTLFMKSFRFVCVNYDYYLFGFSLSLMNNVFSNELCFQTLKIEDVNYLASFFVLELSIPFTFDNYINAVVTCVVTIFV